MKMRTMLILTLLSVGLLVAGTSIAGAGVVAFDSVDASATLGPVNTLSVEPVPYAGGTAESIAFNPVSPAETFLVPPQYIKVDHDDNSLVWEIKIYTDNFFETEPSTTTWGYNYGGMIGLVPGARTPMGWHAGIANSLTSKSAAGDPGADPTVGWNFIKDKSDKDIPETYDPDTGDPIDESWLGPEDDAAYANVAYGTPTWQRIVDTLVGSPDWSYEDGDKTFVVEVEGCFGEASADTYVTTISFDLVHP